MGANHEVSLISSIVILDYSQKPNQIKKDKKKKKKTAQSP